MRVRDPIHGTIEVTAAEKPVIDSAFHQRLRTVKQLGFGELAFPGATHTRFSHSLGAMHVASRLFARVALRAGLEGKVRERFLALVRLSVLCHDLGHLPLSHSSETVAPKLEALGLPSWLTAGRRLEAQASHEDFTALLLLESSLAKLVRESYAPLELGPEAVASLVSGKTPPGGLDLSHRGVDYWPLLRALVSGELDADRMDYLLRDSFFTGVNYGRFDLDWISENLEVAQTGGRAYLALAKDAVFAFEDFLLSRYHMFVSVYYHHTSVSFDTMLRRYCEESPAELQIPVDPVAFAACDDVSLAMALRRSKNRWAERIVQRRPYKLLLQLTERDPGEPSDLERRLAAEGVDFFSAESKGTLSKYLESSEGPGLYVVDPSSGRLIEVTKYTPLYQRYSDSVRLFRLYVRPDQIERARAAVTFS